MRHPFPPFAIEETPVITVTAIFSVVGKSRGLVTSIEFPPPPPIRCECRALEPFRRCAILAAIRSPRACHPLSIYASVAPERLAGVARTRRGGSILTRPAPIHCQIRRAMGALASICMCLHTVYLSYQLLSRLFEAKQRNAIEIPLIYLRHRIHRSEQACIAFNHSC